jgi:hypothetical protein
MVPVAVHFQKISHGAKKAGGGARATGQMTEMSVENTIGSRGADLKMHLVL